MSINEHLIENALSAMENAHSFTEWYSRERNRNPCTIEKADLIWEIAQYVYWTYRPGIIEDTQRAMEEAYGYKL